MRSFERAICCMVLAGLVSCGSSGPVTWEYGPAVDYPVSGSAPLSIPDPVSGGVFHFPRGGGGTLSVMPIISGPLPLPEGAVGFRVSYSAAEPFELHLPRATGRQYLYTAAQPSFSTYDPTGPAGAWLPVASDDDAADPVVFRFTIQPPLPAKADGPTTGVSFLCMRTVYEDPEIAALLQAENTVGLTIEALISKMSSQLQSKVRAALAGPMKRHPTAPLPKGSEHRGSYVGFRYYHWYPRETYPQFSFVVTGTKREKADSSTFAHEAGHYLSHILLGDEGFANLEQQLVKNHQIGQINPGRPMLEEYSQYTDQLLNGILRAQPRWNAAEPIAMFRDEVITEGYKRPTHIDWPGLAGYAAALLTCLMRESPVLATGMSRSNEDIPAFALTPAEVFDILDQHKPQTVNQLRAAVTIHLAKTGRDDALPALLERTGWSYHAKGRVVEVVGKETKGVPDAKVQAVCKAASEKREYLAPLEPVATSSEGYFTLERVFPTATHLRVTRGTVVRDFAVEIDPSKPTQDEVVLKDLNLTSRSYTKLYIQIRAKRSWKAIVGSGYDPGTMIIDNLSMLPSQTAKLEVSDSSITALVSWSHKQSGVETSAHSVTLKGCTFGTKGELKSCPVNYARTTSDGWKQDASFVLDGIPRVSDGNELKFRCEGLQCKPVLQNLVEMFEVGQVAKYEVIPSSIQWDDPLEPALVSVRFSN